jgi:hypothetical protein
MKSESILQLIYASDILAFQNQISDALGRNDMNAAQKTCGEYIKMCEEMLKSTPKDYVLESLKEAYTHCIDVAKKAGNNAVLGDLETKLQKLPTKV